MARKIVKKPGLIPEWKQAWKFLSVQMAVVLAFLNTAYVYLPMMKEYLPESWVSGFAVIIIIARVIQAKADQEVAAEPAGSDNTDQPV